MDPIFAGTLFYIVWPLGTLMISYYIGILFKYSFSESCHKYDSPIACQFVSMVLILALITSTGYIASKANLYAPKLPVSIQVK